jgi:hypothetical protein
MPYSLGPCIDRLVAAGRRNGSRLFYAITATLPQARFEGQASNRQRGSKSLR